MSETINALYELLKIFGSLVAGVILALIFEKPVKRFVARLTARYKRIHSKLFEEEVDDDMDFTIGGWKVPWVVVDGSNTSCYAPENIEVYLEPGTMRVEDIEIRTRIDLIEKEQEQLKIEGNSQLHDGPTLALVRVAHAQVGPLEDPVMKIHLKQSNYFMFLATVNRLDEVYFNENGVEDTLRKKYFTNSSFKQPIPHLASVFAVQMSLITSDGYYLVSKRATSGVVGYQGHLAPALNECIHPIKDYANGMISVLDTVKRAAADELNIDVKEEEIVFFTLGVDRVEYMYTLTGLITSKYTKNDIQSRVSQGTREGFEFERHFYVGPSVGSAAKSMSDLSMDHKWAPYGVVCLIQAMIYRSNSLTTVEKALRKNPRKDQ